MSQLENMILQRSVFFLFFVLSSAVGFLYDDPCDVFPRYSGGIPDSDSFTTTVHVPEKCRNGTFRWDYPKGHVMLQFKNVAMERTTICAKDAIGGDIFTVTETASKEQLAHLDYESWTCLSATSARDIELQVDAPEMMMYMGEFEYKITTS